MLLHTSASHTHNIGSSLHKVQFANHNTTCTIGTLQMIIINLQHTYAFGCAVDLFADKNLSHSFVLSVAKTITTKYSSNQIKLNEYYSKLYSYKEGKKSTYLDFSILIGAEKNKPNRFTNSMIHNTKTHSTIMN